MNTVIYSFYIESNVEPQAQQMPTFDVFKNIDDGTDFTVNGDEYPVIENLGDGYYKFSYTWSETSPTAWLIKIDTGLINVGEKYINLKIEKHDYLPDTALSISESAARIETAASNLQNSSDALFLRVNRLLDIEEGSWEIEGSQLKLYAPENNGTREHIATYQLYNSSGIESAINPFKRTLIELFNRGF